MKPIDPSLVPVVLREVPGEQGTQKEEAVECPARECVVSLDDCLECHASDGMVEFEHRSYVRCRRLAVTWSPPAPRPI